MRDLPEEQRTFRDRARELENEHAGKWVVISGRDVVGVFASYHEAAEMAVARFHRSSFLIRQIGAPAPASSPVALAS